MKQILILTFLILFATQAFGNSLPNPELSPGDINPNTTIQQVCTPGYSKSVRKVSGSTKKKICKAYGVECTPSTYKIDHIIPLAIGGSNDLKNLFPTAYNACPYNAWMKDRLEKYMYASVCRVLKEDGEESAKNLLDTYQKEIAKNWIEAYKKYIVEAGLDKNDKSAKRCVAK